MSNFKVLIGFSDYSDDGLLSKGRVIVDKMNGNANFQNPTPSIADLTTALDKFEAALIFSNGGRGGVEATANKNASREALISTMQNLGLDVQKNGNDDYVILISSGFDIKGTPAPGTQPDAPKNITLSDGAHKGECDVKFDKVVNATMYEVRYSTEPNVATSWEKMLPNTRTRSTITGIAHGTELYVQARAINSHGASEWSNRVDLLIR
jgi:hypothetical protein